MSTPYQLRENGHLTSVSCSSLVTTDFIITPTPQSYYYNLTDITGITDISKRLRKCSSCSLFPLSPNSATEGEKTKQDRHLLIDFPIVFFPQLSAKLSSTLNTANPITSDSPTCWLIFHHCSVNFFQSWRTIPHKHTKISQIKGINATEMLRALQITTLLDTYM